MWNLLFGDTESTSSSEEALLEVQTSPVHLPVEGFSREVSTLSSAMASLPSTGKFFISLFVI